jgi:hypothetical protein
MIDAEKIYDSLTEIKIQLSEHTTILNESVKPDIAQIRDTLVIQNGRIKKTEQGMIERAVYCSDIQLHKDKATIRNRYIITILVAFLGLISGFLYKSERNTKVPIEVIYQKDDSTYVFPHLFIKRGNESTFAEVNKLFVDIKKAD